MDTPEEKLAQARALYEEGWRHYKAENYLGAVEQLESLVAHTPEHPNAENLLGFILTKHCAGDAKSHARGVEILASACGRGGRVLTPFVNLANVDPQRALVVLKSALEKDSGWAAAWNLSGWLKGVKGDDLDTAERELLYACTQSSFGDPHLNLARMYMKTSRWVDAQLQLQSAVRGEWRVHEAWVRLGDCLLQRNLLRRALFAYRKAVEHDQKSEYAVQLREAMGAIEQRLAPVKLPLDADEAFLDSREPDDLKAARLASLQVLLESGQDAEALKRHERWDLNYGDPLLAYAAAAEVLGKRALELQRVPTARTFLERAHSAYKYDQEGASCGGELARSAGGASELEQLLASLP